MGEKLNKEVFDGNLDDLFGRLHNIRRKLEQTMGKFSERSWLSIPQLRRQEEKHIDEDIITTKNEDDSIKNSNLNIKMEKDEDSSFYEEDEKYRSDKIPVSYGTSRKMRITNVDGNTIIIKFIDEYDEEH